MSSVQLYRKNIELTGNALSSDTIASFLTAQGVRSVPDLAINRPMSSAILLFLNRQRALGYWQANGWIRSERESVYLTEGGLDEIELRESGQAIASNGRKKAGNVNPMQVAAALGFIETGQLDETDNDVDVLSETFEL